MLQSAGEKLKCDLLDMNLRNSLKEKRIYGGYDMSEGNDFIDAMRYVENEKAKLCNESSERSKAEQYTLTKNNDGLWSLIEVSGDDVLLELGSDEMLMVLAQVLIGSKDKRPYRGWVKSKKNLEEGARLNHLAEKAKIKRIF